MPDISESGGYSKNKMSNIDVFVENETTKSIADFLKMVSCSFTENDIPTKILNEIKKGTIKQNHIKSQDIFDYKRELQAVKFSFGHKYYVIQFSQQPDKKTVCVFLVRNPKDQIIKQVFETEENNKSIIKTTIYGDKQIVKKKYNNGIAVYSVRTSENKNISNDVPHQVNILQSSVVPIDRCRYNITFLSKKSLKENASERMDKMMEGNSYFTKVTTGKFVFQNKIDMKNLCTHKFDCKINKKSSIDYANIFVSSSLKRMKLVNLFFPNLYLLYKDFKDKNAIFPMPYRYNVLSVKICKKKKSKPCSNNSIARLYINKLMSSSNAMKVSYGIYNIIHPIRGKFEIKLKYWKANVDKLLKKKRLK